MPSNSQSSSLVPLFLFLGALLFAALTWCMVSSCLGKPIFAAFSELWNTLVMSARWNAEVELYESWFDGPRPSAQPLSPTSFLIDWTLCFVLLRWDSRHIP
ncbi:hypothetical protein A0H81_01377 [Grifola frondosa]|uniref:Uncharacterized protein n=1 Tax=Grifola frondosa TaxID=5627 RepID=A0A1C7MPN7_GRIFR|nr:hypothetical protein A0H81_01377 [Grifola frondosa]